MPKQMTIPFGVDSSGSVSVTTDPVQSLADRVRALVATQPGERVMRALYGVATSDLMFSWDATIGQAQLDQRVRDAVGQWEPSARVIAALPSMSADGSQVLGVNVDISAGDPVMVTEASPPYTVVITGTGDVARAG